MERNHSKAGDPHHIRTSVPTLTPAHLRPWPTLCLYRGNREGQRGVRSCQPLAGTLKCVQLMSKILISQSQLMVPWTVRPNYWPKYCLGLKLQMCQPCLRLSRHNWVSLNSNPSQHGPHPLPD